MLLGTLIASPEPNWYSEEMVKQDTIQGRADTDPEALEEAYDRYHREVFSLAMLVLQNQDDAEAVTEKVFLHAWNEAKELFANHEVFSSWLLRVTRSQAIDRLRTRQGSPSSGTLQTEPASVDLPTPASGLDQALLTETSVAELRSSLNDLPPSQREAIQLAYFEGLTQSQIAERLNESRSIIKARIRTGLLALRERLTL
ncbi:MAG: sigma-70 family RNA polymerase sigma factor [Acidobacteriota bacterium]|nr:sigma-70 family RNA polymerase sigma factor [Acidobacteriota bacterium]